MKIGTDGVLLGAWAGVAHKPHSILDIGAGTGLIALMLAQRSLAEAIDALEIDASAFEQCVENFEASPWADRLFCYHAALDEFVTEIGGCYDLIVSNPPFYSELVPSRSASRDQARQNQFLPAGQLLKGVKKILSEKGIFSTIVPFKEEGMFLELAAGFSLFPHRITRVRGNASAGVKRSLLEVIGSPCTAVIDELIIEVDRHVYTEAYKKLTADFYLKMKA